MNITLTKIRNKFPDNSLQDPGREIDREMKLLAEIRLGSSIAIGVGSRGIDRLDKVVKQVVNFVKQKGGRPFIVPAMGSHGGATAEGQQEVLESYGITEAALGVPVKSSMEVIELPEGNCIHPVFMDKNAFESDGIILINKVKPHTDFHSSYESGLVKMTVIGLGKEKGAEAIHHYGVRGLKELLPLAAANILSTGKIIGGIALIENAHDKLMHVKYLPANEFLEKEPELLEIARTNRPGLPAGNLDVLIIDEMGKNISGVGLDTNIIGRLKIYGQQEPPGPAVKSILVTDLTEASHGNATGVGLADVITKRLYDKINFDITYKNIITSSFLERAKIPIVAENDRRGFEIALRNCGNPVPGKERVIRIRNTLYLNEVYVSDEIIKELKDKPVIEIIEKKKKLINNNNEFFSF